MKRNAISLSPFSNQSNQALPILQIQTMKRGTSPTNSQPAHLKPISVNDLLSSSTSKPEKTPNILDILSKAKIKEDQAVALSSKNVKVNTCPLENAILSHFASSLHLLPSSLSLLLFANFYRRILNNWQPFIVNCLLELMQPKVIIVIIVIINSIFCNINISFYHYISLYINLSIDVYLITSVP